MINLRWIPGLFTFLTSPKWPNLVNFYGLQFPLSRIPYWNQCELWKFEMYLKLCMYNNIHPDSFSGTELGILCLSPLGSWYILFYIRNVVHLVLFKLRKTQYERKNIIVKRKCHTYLLTEIIVLSTCNARSSVYCLNVIFLYGFHVTFIYVWWRSTQNTNVCVCVYAVRGAVSHTI